MLSLIEEDKGYKNMSKILNNIMPLDPKISNKETEFQGFNKTYKYNYPNHYNSYNSVQNYLSQLFMVLSQWKHQNDKKISNLPKIEKSPNFEKIWTERFELQIKNDEMVPHQNNFRREIHKQISNIEFLNNEKNKDEPIIYLMELGKARKDLPQGTLADSDITKFISKELDKKKNQIDTKGKVLKLSVYGIYDWVIIKEKNSEINIVDKLNELISHAQIIDNPKENLKHFITKQVLMKVHEGYNNPSMSSKTDYFSVIFNIEIAKKINNDECTNGYNDLNGAIQYIAKQLKKNQEHFRNANIYKSLGPKDITVIVQDASLESIFKLLEALNQQRYNKENKKVEILRTFTILCSTFGKNIIIKSGFSIISYLRISDNFKHADIEKLKDNTKMERFTEVTGVMDFRIHWKKDILVQDILDFYSLMIEKSLLTDFQTKIEKNISLE
jgi:hypothetical protein